MHFNAIFITEVGGFYLLDILGQAGSACLQPAMAKALCWGLVSKLLQVIFKEIQKVRMEAAGLENIWNGLAWVNELYLYAALDRFSASFMTANTSSIPSSSILW